MSPQCGAYTAQKSLLSERLDTEDASVNAGRPGRLEAFLSGFRGAGFESAVDPDPYRITATDLEALKLLNVGVAPANRARVLETEADAYTALLRDIPADQTLEDVSPVEFDSTLGSDSPAWKLWAMLRAALFDQGHQGGPVTAGKILYGKRQALVPLFDSRIRENLAVTNLNVWETYWCFLHDDELRSRLEDLRRLVPLATERDVSLIRIIDIIAWME